MSHHLHFGVPADLQYHVVVPRSTCNYAPGTLLGGPRRHMVHLV